MTTAEPKPASLGDVLPAWLAQAKANPPPEPDPEVLARNARADRFGALGAIRERLPEFLTAYPPRDLPVRIRSKKFRDIAQAWDPRKHGSVLFCGESDEGKTTAVGTLVLRLLHQGVRDGGAAWELAQGLRWFRAGELADLRRAHPRGRGECIEVAEAIKAPLLVLDDIGRQDDTDLLTTVFDARFDRGGALTFITTGRPIDDLRARYGYSVMKRLTRFQERTPIIVQSFPSLEKEPTRPPGDQKEQGRRLGEKDDD